MGHEPGVEKDHMIRNNNNNNDNSNLFEQQDVTEHIAASGGSCWDAIRLGLESHGAFLRKWVGEAANLVG